MIIVGSRALKVYFPNIDRQVGDVDVIGTNEDIKYLIDTLKPKEVKETPHLISLFGIENKTTLFNTDNVEILNADTSDALKKYLEYSKLKDKDMPEIFHIPIEFAPLEVIYSIKKSHIHFPIKFDKHIKDYCLLNDFFEGEDRLSDITKLNFKETEDRVGKLKTPSLNKSTNQFFGQSKDYVQSFFIHDHIHMVMSHYDRPIYERMQKDSTLAKCEKDMWDEFSFEDKCKAVLEEAYVIALERKIIPCLYGGKDWVPSDVALNWALMRICTTLCSGWFRKFATDNYFRIKEYINPNYVEKFLEKVQNKEIERCQ
jgi:hypothetical protein